MRRRVLFLIICGLIVAALVLAGTVCLADSAGVSVEVRVASVIHVRDSAAVPANIDVITQAGGGQITFVSP